MVHVEHGKACMVQQHGGNIMHTLRRQRNRLHFFHKQFRLLDGKAQPSQIFLVRLFDDAICHLLGPATSHMGKRGEHGTNNKTVHTAKQGSSS